MFSICGNGCIKLWRNESRLERVSNNKTFINKNKNWKGIKIDDWKMFAKNNPTFALNILNIKEK